MADRNRQYARFHEPVPGIFPLDADVERIRAMPVPEYWIQQRVGEGDWELKCRYGQDVDWAVERVR